MDEISDLELLQQYLRQGSETAFATLVGRHLNLVYSAAFRHVGQAAHAEEIAQAVFIILARKAAGLRPDTVLPAWLHETTRLTALSHRRGERRRQSREQEAYMQSTQTEPAEAAVWGQLAPLLDDAVSRLGKKDRDAVVLRFFQNRNLREVAGALQISEAAAQKRVHRAVEKLRKIFTKRGVSSTTAILAGAISANSVSAAPVGLAKTISVIAVAKGAAAGTTTLTLVKGALKIMAWTNMKTAIVLGVGLLLAAGTTTIAIKEVQDHETYPWQVPGFTNIAMEAAPLLAKTPPQVRILRSKYSYWVKGTPFTQGDMEMMRDGKITVQTNQSISIGIGVTADQIVEAAYGVGSLQTVYKTKLPEGRYDFIANLPHGALPALQAELKKKLGLVGKWEMVETNVLALVIADLEPKGFKPASGFGNKLDTLRTSLQNIVGDGQLVIDATGLTNRYDFTFNWPNANLSLYSGKQAILDALYDQLGLKLVPTNMPVKRLVVEKAKWF